VTTRRNVLLAGSIALLIANRATLAQTTASIRRVGWVSLGSNASPAEAYAAFKQGMRDLGWLEGKNVEYQGLYADGDLKRLDALASELIKQQVDVILVGNATSTRALQRATKTIPIVMSSVNNVVGNRFVASLAKPGGNITGISTQSDEVLGKLIGILHELVPEARRIAVMLNESNPNHAVFWAGAQSACATLDLVALRVAANAPAQFGATIEQIVRQRSQAVVVVPDPVFLNERVKLQELLHATRLPVAYGWREHVIGGGLVSYAADLPATARHAATYVDRILKGAKPADLPVEQATKFELVINLKTAKSLGISIPKDVLLRADEVIQ
jgi:putative tryptophan/tyrosine transport system substrate-binding protein